MYRFSKKYKSDKKTEVTLLRPAEITILSKIEGSYSLEKGQSVFTDTTLKINDIAPELRLLKGISFAKSQQILEGTKIEFSSKTPVKVLVGYFNESQQMYSNKKSIFLPKPQLEIDASANNFGQSEAKITNALLMENWGSVNIHTYTFEAGTNTLTLGKGVALILGFVEGKQDLKVFDAGLAGNMKNIDCCLSN